ncbi:MAG: hypothetical protein RI601_03550 [Desulfurivibrionaceae bacterium]|nr:hypothetical protein [Desulfurivibrionaceae bacterium]
MKKRIIMVSALAAIISLPAGLALAADPQPQESTTQTENQGEVYGSQLMTQQERLEYRNRMQAAQSEEERQQIRNEHHKTMQERARKRGLTLPEAPPAGGGGMAPGGGMGGGMGTGGGRAR